MRTIVSAVIVSAVALASSVVPGIAQHAPASSPADQVMAERMAKLTRAAERTAKRIEAEKACEADRVACLTKERDRAKTAAERAATKLHAAESQLAAVAH